MVEGGRACFLESSWWVGGWVVAVRVILTLCTYDRVNKIMLHPPLRAPSTPLPPPQTGFTTNKEDPKYNYELRRQSLRSSWVPATDEARKELLEGLASWWSL